MRISDWSSDVCSSDLEMVANDTFQGLAFLARIGGGDGFARDLGDDAGQHLLIPDQLEKGVVGLPSAGHIDADFGPDRLDGGAAAFERLADDDDEDRKSTRLNSSH